jgi:hypothetical protein
MRFLREIGNEPSPVEQAVADGVPYTGDQPTDHPGSGPETGASPTDPSQTEDADAEHGEADEASGVRPA